MNYFFEQIQARIQLTLDSSPDYPLISDSKVTWTGKDIVEKITPLRAWILRWTFRGSRVGVSLSDQAAQALAIIAVLESGRIPVILSYEDFSSDPQYWIDKAQISTMITSPDATHLLDDKICHVFLSASGELSSYIDGKKAFHWLEEYLSIPKVGTALILFTSGTTGEPKGVLVPAEGLLKTIDYLIERFSLGRSAKSLVQLPIYHSMALNTQFLPTFFAGGHSHFCPSRLSLNTIYRTILNQKGTFISLISETLQTCRREKVKRNLPAAEHVQHIQLAGGKISDSDMDCALELFPNAVIHKGYGLTEAIRVSMISSRDANFDTDSVGQALPFVEIEIRNGQGLAITEANVQGQVFVKGPNTLVGFSGQKESPTDDRGFLATGDIGHWNEEKELCIFGRHDSLFKINGQRVSGYEIERIAMSCSSVIRNAKCTLQKDSKRDGQKIILMLEIDKSQQSRFLKTEIEKFERKLWMNFQALSHSPKEIFILERFPKTSNGKISIKKLNELYENSNNKQIIEDTSSVFQFYQVQELR